jgi:intracellular sulfur oxidation DsrE/DsrF family protein
MCRPITGVAVAAFALALAGFSPVAAPADQVPATLVAAKQNRLVFQVSDNDPAKWNLALNNARNVQQDIGASNVDIEIVVYGPGIGMLKIDSVAGNRVAEAMASGVKVVACENTMHGQKLTKADMLASIAYVPAGVVELMQKQQQGWAYVKP